jgi:citrate lyase subunit beta/citryl-CoA lyase
MPGSNTRALERAKQLAADVLILDLEDAVAPAMKVVARSNVAEAVRGGGYGSKELVVRINSRETNWGLEDLEALAGLGINAVLLPKVESSQPIVDVARFLDENDFGRSVKIWAMIETPKAFFRLEEIATSDSRLEAMVLGTTDLTNELRARHTNDRIALNGLLSNAVAAARAFGLAVLDGVHLRLDDETGFSDACRQGRDMGFDGKTLIHPKQIEIANDAFGINDQEAAEARRLIEAYSAARVKGDGVVVVDGKLVEAMHVDEALRTVALWEATKGQPSG